MAGRSGDSRWFVVTGGTVFTPLGKKYRKVSVFTANESELDNRIRLGLLQVYGSDPFAEVDDEDGSSHLPWWALGAPLKNLGKVLDDSTALSCLERHLQRRHNLVPTTSLIENSNSSAGSLASKDSLLLIYQTNPLLTFENQQDPLTKDSFLTYLEAWSEIVYAGYEVDIDPIDLSSRSVATQRPSAIIKVPTSQQEPRPRPGSGQSTEAISLPATEIIEAREYCEEEICGPGADNPKNPNHADGDEDGITFDRSHPRRSTRIFVLESIPKKKEEPGPPALEIKKKKKKKEEKEKKKSSEPSLEVRQSNVFRTRPMPKKPVTVICGDAEGMWSPHNPLVITITKVGNGNGCPEAIAAAAEFSKKKKRNLVVTGNQFEKIGGKGPCKNWKNSVRITPDSKRPDEHISISQFALEIGIPFEKKLRGPVGQRYNGTGNACLVPRSLEEIKESRLALIKDTLEKAGYSWYMAEKRVNSKRTFRGNHRPGHPGVFDWKLLLPGGVWVRSLDGIFRHPKTGGMDENDVLFSDDEEEGGKGGTTRVKCHCTKHCIFVPGHAGKCTVHYNFKKRQGVYKEKKTSSMNKRKKNTDDAAGNDESHDQNLNHLYYSWENMVGRQKGDRKDRWLKRQGLRLTNSDGEVNINDEEEPDTSLGNETSEGYGGLLGFTSTEEEDYWEEGQGEPMLEDCDKL